MAIRGLKAHTSRLQRLPAAAEKAVTAAVFAAAERIANEAGLSITRGAVSGAGHVASKPGEAPNSDTHGLDRSIQAVKFGRLKAKVIVTAPYAGALEFGTSRIAARPFLRPARDKKKEEARDLVVKGLNAALRAAQSSKD